MNALDFISNSPSIYIFQKRANKTNLGGILTIIYLIILTITIFSYLYDYSIAEKYEYSYFEKYFLKESDKEKTRNDERYNPYTNFSFDILDKKGQRPKNFSINIIGYKTSELETVDMGENITKKPGDFLITLAYQYPINSTFKHELYNFIVFYSSKIIDNDNNDSPVADVIFNSSYKFYLDKFFLVDFVWKVTNYEEKKGIISRVSDSIFNKPNSYTFGKIENILDADQSEDDTEVCENDICYKHVLFMWIINPFDSIQLYKRKAISIWNYFANIAALGTTIFNGFCTFFGLIYSHNFDNYKIVENILSKGTKKLAIKELNNKTKSNSDLDANLLNNNIDDKRLYNNEGNSSNEDILINNIDDIDEEDNIDKISDIDDIKITKLPKLRFFDFIFNLLYSKCCLYIRKQKLIDSCDLILYKYYSIENILYNQILFENLLKDYKWNNPKLKSIYNNELILNINKYLK